MIKVKQSLFIKSCADPNEFSGGAFCPQICVAGRSNCGKSSLLNYLMGAKLCKTSSAPGRTRLINVFETKIASDASDAGSVFFIDLPGYGFNSAAKSEGDDFGARTSKYFETAGDRISQALALMDIRRDPSELDKVLINYFRDLSVPFTVVATKADKLSRSRAAEARIKIAAALGVARDNIIVTSSQNRTGGDEVWARIESVISRD